MQMNTRNQMLLKKAEVVLTLAKKEKDFVYGLLGKTLEERNALEKELEALKEKYKELEELYHDYDSPYERDDDE